MRATKQTTLTREDWLRQAVAELTVDFIAQAATIPDKLRIGVGFPSSRALSQKRKRVGECWAPICSGDGSVEIVISPVLGTGLEALDCLVHELVHACVGHEAGHKGPFKKLAVALGLEGKMTATKAGTALTERLNALVTNLGNYPHAKLSVLAQRKKQSTRMIKLECGSCGYIVRTTAKWLEVGNPICPCGETLEQ